MSANKLSVEALATDLKRVVRDSEELLRATAGVVGDKAQEVRQRLDNALEAAKRTCYQVEEKAIEGAKATDKVIREHPYQSIGAAFGIGLLVGVVVTRR
jgi:ElaB/YqjD/DUF883 family membrane-anchored ribosome-binding protein